MALSHSPSASSAPRHPRRHQIAPGTRVHRKAPPFAIRGPRLRGMSPIPFIAGPLGAIVSVIATFLLIGGGAMVASLVAAGGLFAYFTHDLPQFDPNRLAQFETSRIYDRYGNLIEEISDPQNGRRDAVTLDKISPFIIDGTIAAEDKTFWSNPGVDAQALGRAVRNTFIDSSFGSSGASTITMQVIKQAFPDRYTNPTKEDKVKQVFAAYTVAQKYKKEEVLTFYLNNVFYGNRSYGIQAAAQNYFHVDAKDLTLWQGSMLAGLGQAPSSYDPTQHLDRARVRQRYVLGQMVAQDYITQAQMDNAYTQSGDPAKYFTFKSEVPSGAPHFVNYVRQYVEQQYGAEALYQGGLRIYTTIDMDVQKLAEDVVRTNIAREKQPYDVSNGALVAVIPWSGQILCMVGSVDFNDKANGGEFNVAVNPRQPGSSIKPIAYALALAKGWYPSYTVLDYHKTWDDGTKDGYTPNNDNMLHNGAVTVRDALQQSLNIPALKAMEFDFTKDGSKYGQYDDVRNFISFAHDMGIKSGFNRDPKDYGLGIALALGGGEVTPLELTNAYATLANQGMYVPANPIIRITTADGKIFKDPNTGKLVDNSQTAPKGTKVLDPGTAYLMTNILTDNKARTPIFGASSPLILRDRPVAAKTGTTNDFRDGWTVGYSTQIAVGVWVGNNDNHAMREGVDGVENAAPIWNEFMRVINNYEKPYLLFDKNGNVPALEFERPPSIVEGKTCPATGHQPLQYGTTTTDLFVMGHEPTLKCGELNPREQKELVEAWADFTKDPNLLARQGGTVTPTPPPSPTRKIEYGRYTSLGSSRLTQYYGAVDPQYRPKFASSGYVAPAPAPVRTNTNTSTNSTPATPAPVLTQAPAPMGAPPGATLPTAIPVAPPQAQPLPNEKPPTAQAAVPQGQAGGLGAQPAAPAKPPAALPTPVIQPVPPKKP